MWVLEQVADLVIDLERPVIVKEIGIKPFHSHPYSVLQMTTDDYGVRPPWQRAWRKSPGVLVRSRMSTISGPWSPKRFRNRTRSPIANTL